MSGAKAGAKRRWLISAVGAAVVVGAVLLLFRAPAPVVESARRPAKPTIALTPGRPDELAMRDLAPLFLPTPYNAAPPAIKPPEPGAPYFDVDPGMHLSFDPEDPSLHLPPAVHAPEQAVAVVADVPPPLARGMGQTDRTIPALPANGGHVDIFAGEMRDSVFGLTLDVDAKAPIAEREKLGWKPLELLAAVDAEGLVGPLLVTSSSGVEEIDTHFRNYLARTFRIGDRLPPGFYRIVVGP